MTEDMEQAVGSRYEPQAVSAMLLPALDARTPLEEARKYGGWAEAPHRAWARPLVDLMGERAHADELVEPAWDYEDLAAELRVRGITLPDDRTISECVEFVADGIIRNYVKWVRDVSKDAERTFAHEVHGMQHHPDRALKEVAGRFASLHDPAWQLVVALTVIDVARLGKAPDGTWPEAEFAQALAEAKLELPMVKDGHGGLAPMSITEAIDSVLAQMRTIDAGFVEANIDGPMNRVLADPGRGDAPVVYEELETAMPGAYLKHRSVDQMLAFYADLDADLDMAQRRLTRRARQVTLLAQARSGEADLLVEGMTIASAATPDRNAWDRWTTRAREQVTGLFAPTLEDIVEAAPHEAVLSMRDAERELRQAARRLGHEAGVLRGAAALAASFDDARTEGPQGVSAQLRVLAETVDEVEESRPVASASTNPLLIDVAAEIGVVPADSDEFAQYCADIAVEFMRAIGYAPKPCAHDGCPNRRTGGHRFCPEHQSAR